MSSEEASAILEPAATRVRDPRSGRSSDGWIITRNVPKKIVLFHPAMPS